MSNQFFQRYGHYCKLETENNDGSWTSYHTDKYLRCIRKAFMVSSENNNTYKIFNSQHSIANERHRHSSYDPYVIHPLSLFRTYVELFMIFTLCYLFTIIPLQWITTTDNMDIEFLVACGCFFHVVYIVLNFNTGYMSDTDVLFQLNRTEIVKHYLLGYFIIDFISSCPYLLYYFSYEYIRFVFHPDTMIVLRFVSRSLLCIKLLRLKTLITYTKRTLEYFGVLDTNVQDIVFLTLYGIFILHFATCVQLISDLKENFIFTQEEIPVEWFGDRDLGNLKYVVTYFMCLQRSLSAMAGFGNIFIQLLKLQDIILTSALVIIGRIYMILLLAMFIEIIQGMSSSSYKHKANCRKYEAYSRYKRLSPELHQKLMKYIEHKYQSAFYHEEKILSGIPTQLKEEIILFKTSIVMNSITFLKTIPAQIAVRILSCLHFELIMAKEKLFETDDTGEVSALYFVIRGTLAHYSPSGQEFFHAVDGDYTGEMCLLTNNRHRMCTCTAVETTELRLMHSADFMRIIQYYPDLESTITKKAATRLELLIQTESKLQRRREQIARRFLKQHHKKEMKRTRTWNSYGEDFETV